MSITREFPVSNVTVLPMCEQRVSITSHKPNGEPVFIPFLLHCFNRATRIHATVDNVTGHMVEYFVCDYHCDTAPSNTDG